MKREDQIDDWYDRRIIGGQAVDDEIAQRLEDADVFIALVSPDFIHSNYCYEREMERALERQRNGSMKIVPVILQPCDWETTPLRKFKALPRDGLPISEWRNENAAFVDVVKELRRLSQETGIRRPERAPLETERKRVDHAVGRARYRAKRDFNKIERADFRDSAFRTIRDFFEREVERINETEGLLARYREISNTSFTCTVVNGGKRNAEAHITVHCGGDSALGDVYFSFVENAGPNTANGWFRVDSDEYELFLRSEGGMPWKGGGAGRVTAEEAAERTWRALLENAGISYG